MVKFFLALLLLSETFGGIRYSLKIEGWETFPYLKDAIFKLSELENPESDFNPETDGILRDMGKKDIQKIKEYLISQGFYDADVYQDFKELSETECDITYHVELGRRYCISNIMITNEKGKSLDSGFLESKSGDPIDHSVVLSDKITLGMHFKSIGYAYAKILPERIIVNHQKASADVIFSIETGPKVRFGKSKIEGLFTVDKPYLEKFIRWTEGEQFSAEHINETQQNLLETGLFQSVEITPLPHHENIADIEIRCVEKKAQKVGFRGFGRVYLNQNPSLLGIGVGYTHKNLFGANEQLKCDALLKYQTAPISALSPGVLISVLKPNWPFLGLEWSLTVQKSNAILSFIKDRDSLSIDKNMLGAETQVTYKPISFLELSLAPQVEKISLETSHDLARNYSYFVIPIKATFDIRNNKLFSQTGVHLSAGLSGYMAKNQQTFFKFLCKASAYVPIFSEDIIVALMAQYRSLLVNSLDSVPIDQRFFLGGSDHLRGYPNNYVGTAKYSLKDKNLFLNNAGGLSSVNWAIEPRFRIYKNNVWISTFLEAGQIAQQPNFFNAKKDPFLWNVGVGVLFMISTIGPFRVDLAYALTDQFNTYKEKIQFMFGFGQSF